MKEYVEEYVNKKGEDGTIEVLSSDNRNLLSVAYKNVVGGHRSSWRIAFSVNQKDPKPETNEYLKSIESDLKKVCNEVLVSLYVLFVVLFVVVSHAWQTVHCTILLVLGV